MNQLLAIATNLVAFYTVTFLAVAILRQYGKATHRVNSKEDGLVSIASSTSIDLLPASFALEEVVESLIDNAPIELPIDMPEYSIDTVLPATDTVLSPLEEVEEPVKISLRRSVGAASANDLSFLTVQELRQYAKAQNVPIPRKIRKKQEILGYLRSLN
jgi:hypothetical protein